MAGALYRPSPAKDQEPMGNSAATGALDTDLARRLHRALTAGREELFQVLEDPSPEVLRAALKNPLLDEGHLLDLLKRSDLAEELLKAVYQLERFKQSHRLQVALAYNPGTPAPVVMALLPQLYLFELVTLCYLPGVTPDQRLAAERAIIRRLPTTELGNKLTLAHRGTTAVVGELLKEGDPRLIDACLANPRLKEAALYQFLTGPKATPDTISVVARHPRWQNRPNLRLAILKNQKTPLIWYTVMLPRLKPPELKSLLITPYLNPAQKQAVEEELRRRSHG